MKGEFLVNTKRTLAKRAGEKCTLCGIGTCKPHSIADFFVNIGEAAHIKGRVLGKFNRYDPTMTNSERSNISNGIWLCSTCHTKIDQDDIKYTVAFLMKAKEEHEKHIASGYYDQKFPDYDLQQRVKHDQNIFNLSQVVCNEVHLNLLLDHLARHKFLFWQDDYLKSLNNYLEFHNLVGNKFLIDTLNFSYSNLRFSINELLFNLYNVEKRETKYDVLFHHSLSDSFFIGMKPLPQSEISLLYDQNTYKSYRIKYDVFSSKIDNLIDELKSCYTAYRELVKMTIYL